MLRSWLKKNFSLFSFFMGSIITLLILGFFYLKDAKKTPFSLGILDNNKEINIVVPRSEAEGKNNPLDNFERYHSDTKEKHRKVYATYFITKDGFHDIVDSSIFDGLRIDFGCNGESGAKHKFGLYFSGHAKKAMNKPSNPRDSFQYFAPMRDPNGRLIVNRQGNLEEGYANKTCPCPLEGGVCNCDKK